MPTSSSAQPMMAFSSPLLSSVDRLLRGFDSRFGSASFLSTLNRFESFTDRLLGRRLSSLGLPVQSSGFAPRELPPFPTLEHADSWIASPRVAATRASARTQAAAATTKPVASRLPAVAMPSVQAAPVVGPATLANALPVAATVPSSPAVAPISRGVAPSERARTILPELSDAGSSVGSVPAASTDSDEPRGLDLVLRSAPLSSQPRPPSPEILKLSALARSFMHLGWSDARLGMGGSDPAVAMLNSAGSLPMARADLSAEPSPVQSARIASGSALAQTMVAPDAVRSRSVQAAPSAGRSAPNVPPKGLPLADVARRSESPAETIATGSGGAAAVPASSVGTLSGAAPSVAVSPTVQRAQSVESLSGAALSSALAAAPAVDNPSEVASSFAPAASALPLTVSERAVASPRRAVVAEMADLLGPWSAGLSPSLWLGETVSRERASAATETAQAASSARMPSKPLTAPGQISSQVEQFAARMGLATGAPLPSVDRPRFAAEWSRAPGLSSSVQRLLQTQAHGESTDLSRTLPSLTMVAAPGLDRPSDKPAVSNRVTGQASDKAATRLVKQADAVSSLPSVRSLASDGTAVEASTPTRNRREQPALSSDSSVAAIDRPSDTPMLSSDRAVSTDSVNRAASGSATAAGRPWQQMGGVATLAELFAAGVGLSSGVAQRAAESAGLSLAPSVLPSWLSLSSRPLRADADEASSWAGPVLSFLSPDLALPTANRRESLAARSPVPRENASPEVSRQAPRALSSPTDRVASVADASLPGATIAPSALSSDARRDSVDRSSLSADAASPVADSMPPAVRRFVLPSQAFGQVGGLAASSEAFARSHGIARVEELLGSGSQSVATPSQFVSLAGGEVLVPSAGFRRADRPSLEARPAQNSAADAGSDAAPSFQRALPSSSLTSSSSWQRPGGMALRSELLAMQMAGVLPWLQPADAKQWQKAPGLSSSLASLLASTEVPQVPPRWAMGDRGLLFVAGSPVDRALRFDGSSTKRGLDAGTRVAAPSLPSGLTLPPSVRSSEQLALTAQVPQALSSVNRASDAVASSGTSLTQALSDRLAPSVGRAEGAAFVPSFLRQSESDLPWLRVGGMGALAELFAAGVGVGTGAAQSLAQSFGVSSGRSLTPEWLLNLAAQSGTPELSSRLASLLPSLVLPSVSGLTAQKEPATRQVKQDSGAASASPAGSASKEASTATQPSLGSLLTGGLAASAESFARHFGIERVAGGGEADAQAASGAEGEGRWLNIAGGMVFLPKDQPVSSAARPVSPPTSSAGLSPSLAVGQLGATALRSEIFSALVGPQRTLGDLVSQSSSKTAPGWDNIASLLVSLPKSAPSEEPSLPRWGLSRAGGLMFVAAPSMKQERSIAPLRSEPSSVQRASLAQKNAMPPSVQPFAVATLAESIAERSSSMGQSAQHIASPLLSLVDGPSQWNNSRRSVADVEQAYTQRLVTSFPRQAQEEGAEPTPTSLWPTATLTQVQRLEKVVSMLPSEWQPSLKVVAALRQSGVAQTPLWQELPKALNTVNPYETADDGESASSSLEQISASALRSPALSLVERAAPASATPRTAPAQTESSKQQSVERVMSEAVASLIKSGGQAAASARLLDAIRSHATNQPTRSDDRLNLSDLTLIALSMGQNRIAASSPDHPKDRLEPNVGNALRMKHSKHVEDDKNSYRKTVSEHAEQVVKHMKDQLEKQKLRGQF